ncbi:hypothetical protein DU504_14395 [Haloplanus salinus]|uniref:DUF1102 domain-containing protein n=1 Tax=Haloplanus salinus TaxID=1126245 RepID=A0A368NCR1_9EURY|nr:hypothetical protein DU504_14395 [Haloplanus salinus]
MEVADDSSAFLQIQESDGSNAAYANETNGTLEFNIDDAANTDGGQGLNDDARTIIRDVFQITNQGTQAVYVFIETEDIPDGVGIFSDYPANAESGAGDPGPGSSEPTVGLGEGTQSKTGAPDHPKPERILVPVGETMDEIGFSFKTGSYGSLDEADFPWTLTIQAVAKSEY